MIRDWLIVHVLGEFLYPWPMNCMECGAATNGEHALCGKCRAELAIPEALCGFAGDNIGTSVAAHRYSGVAGTLVRSLKYRSLSALAREMAREMIDAANRAGMLKPDAVVYVPMHTARRRAKYFDQAELLAKLVAREWGVKVKYALKRVRRTRQQARVHDAEMRARNIRGAFAVCKDVQGKRVVLIDDVHTTGATACECARVLMEAGASRVDLLVYAQARSSGNGKNPDYTV